MSLRLLDAFIWYSIISSSRNNADDSRWSKAFSGVYDFMRVCVCLSKWQTWHRDITSPRGTRWKGEKVKVTGHKVQKGDRVTGGSYVA